MARTQGTSEHCLPLLGYLSRLGGRGAEAALAPTGLRPRHIVALRLLSEQGAASQQGLATQLSLDPSNVVGLLNELEERGLVVRRRDPSDRRRHIVEISPRGAECLRDAQQRLSESERNLLRGLSATQRSELYVLLEAAAASWLTSVDAADAGESATCRVDV